MTTSTAFLLDPPRDATLLGPYASKVVQAVVTGLLRQPRSLPRWLGGALDGGVDIGAIVDEHAADIARFVGTAGRIAVVDVGGHAGERADLLVESLVQQHVMARTVEVDDLDFDVAGPRCVLWLGNPLSRFDAASASSALHRLAGRLDEGDWLVLGVAGGQDGEEAVHRFHQQMLNRVNREAGADFVLGGWRDGMQVSRDGTRVQTYIESTREQQIVVDALGLSLLFQKGERIDTGSRPIWDDDTVAAVLEDAGFYRDVVFVDEDAGTAVHLARI